MKTHRRKPSSGMKNITRIHAHNELGSRRSRNMVMIANAMLINRITVISVVTIETASPNRDSQVTLRAHSSVGAQRREAGLDHVLDQPEPDVERVERALG